MSGKGVRMLGSRRRRHIRKQIIKRDGMRCAWCSKDTWSGGEEPPLGFSKKQQLTLDHVIPATKGGQDHITNLIVSCAKCNVKRDTMDASLYLYFAINPRTNYVQAAIQRVVAFELGEPT